jgi:CDP-diacylglycerol---serine O-phosphatidyltransferase
MADNDQQPSEETYSRFRPVPIRYLLPNLITLIALCSGVTAIRLAFEGRFEIAAAAVILAIGLDAIDGRLARMLQGTSRFGAELDSLADFVNFGVAPTLILYFWSLNTVRPVGWVICLMLSIACALRLARFNVMLEDPNKPAYAANFFTGIPAPAGAALALIPLYYGFLVGDVQGHKHAIYVAPLIVAISAMMVSRVPTFSGKSFTRVPRDAVIPVLALAALLIICVITFPWQTMLAVSLAYAAMIPVSVVRFWQLRRADNANKSETEISS